MTNATDSSGSDRSTKHKTKGSDEVLAAEIVAGHTIVRAAKAAGMSEPTARRRLKEPTVIEMMNDLRFATLTAAADRLASIAAGAAVELGRIITNPRTNDSVKVRAIAIAIREGLRLRSDIITEERLTAIEQHLEAERQVQAAQGLRLAVAR
jgi:hypothetical protein